MGVVRIDREGQAGTTTGLGHVALGIPRSVSPILARPRVEKGRKVSVSIMWPSADFSVTDLRKGRF